MKAITANVSPSVKWDGLLLLLTAIAWGTSYGSSKYSLLFISVMGLIAVRFLLTAAILVPYFLRLPRAVQWRCWQAGWPVGVGLFAIFMAEIGGVAHTTASRAAFLISLCMIFTLPVEWLWMKKRPVNSCWWAAGVAFIGTWCLTGGVSDHWNIGDALMLIAAVLRAFQGCLVTHCAKKYQPDQLGLTAVQSMMVGAMGLMCWLVQAKGQITLPTQANFWIVIVYLVLACTLFAFYAMNRALANTSPAKVAVLLGSEPFWGAMFAVLFLGEELTMIAWLGGCLIMVSAWWVNRANAS